MNWYIELTTFPIYHPKGETTTVKLYAVTREEAREAARWYRTMGNVLQATVRKV